MQTIFDTSLVKPATSKVILKAMLVSSFLLLPACHFVDVIIGPPCTSCSSGGYDGGYDSGSSNDDSGWGSSDREPNPPRYEDRDDPRRDERDARNREREREHRPPTQLQMATMTLMQKYSLREDSAVVLAKELLLARVGKSHSLEALGIQKTDLEAMARGDNPSAHVLVTMAEVLKMDINEVHLLIQKIKTDIEKN